jgi:hypothetical protein
MTSARWWGNLLRNPNWLLHQSRSHNQSGRYWLKQANLSPQRIAVFERHLARLINANYLSRWPVGNPLRGFVIWAHDISTFCVGVPQEIYMLPRALYEADFPRKETMFPKGAGLRFQQGVVLAWHGQHTPGVLPLIDRW